MKKHKDYRHTLAVDFDGVLHDSDGEPIKGAYEVIKELSKHYEVIIFTARENHKTAKKWLKEKGFPLMEVTSEKPKALAYIDNRAIRFTNWEDIGKYFL